MENIWMEKLLFNADLLYDINENIFEKQYSLNVTPSNPGPGLELRPLKPSDHGKGFLQLLSMLTVAGDVSQDKFLDTFTAMERCENMYYVTVIEDTNKNKVIGTATLFIEQKFIRNCAKKGGIEDVVIHDHYRGRQLGKLLLATLVQLAKNLDCYKVSLQCKDSMVPYYNNIGFINEPGNSNHLQIRF